MKSNSKNFFSTIAAVSMILPVFAIAAGVYLVTRPQTLESEAAYRRGREPRERIGIRTQRQAKLPRFKRMDSKKKALVKPTAAPTRAVVAEATLVGQLQLEGRPKPPNKQWKTAIAFTARQTSQKYPKYTRLFVTDERGVFTLDKMEPGEYEITVKGVHTLRVKRTVSLKPGTNHVSFDTLLEGDADNNNKIDSNDLQLLSKSFNKRRGQSGYNENADFNQDGKVDILDFSLLAKNWQKTGASQ